MNAKHLLDTCFSSNSFTILFIITSFLLIAGIILIIIQKQSINRIYGIIAAFFVWITLNIAAASGPLGTFYIKTSGNPAYTVEQFYNSIVNDNYESAYKYLADYSTLGLDNLMDNESEDGILINSHLKSSYSYSLVGDPVVNGLDATQKVTFTCLDINRLQKDSEEQINDILNEKVQNLPKAQVFDDNGDYRQDILDQVYIEALNETLKNEEHLMTTLTYNVQLKYDGNSWRLYTNDQMIKGFLGGKGK